MNFSLSAVDDLLRHPDDKPSIGLILCKDKNKFIAEYALRGTLKPIGVAEYITAESLPDQLKGSLPTIEQIEEELSTDLRELADEVYSCGNSMSKKATLPLSFRGNRGAFHERP
jgi:hypothetical protein